MLQPIARILQGLNDLAAEQIAAHSFYAIWSRGIEGAVEAARHHAVLEPAEGCVAPHKKTGAAHAAVKCSTDGTIFMFKLNRRKRLFSAHPFGHFRHAMRDTLVARLGESPIAGHSLSPP